jgi:hypothetical protein
MGQGDSVNSIDVYYENGNLFMSNGIDLGSEPSVGGIPTSIGATSNDNQFWDYNYGTGLTTTGGTGRGLTVNVSDGGSGFASITINNPGSGYTTGDTITVTNGPFNDAPVVSTATFAITASALGVWTHVALSSDEGLVKVYYNGVEQSSIQRNLSLTDASRDLYIGRRGNNDFQYFNGNLAMIRISNAARYLTNFSPSVSYGVEADTRLMLGSDTPLVDLSQYELTGVTLVTDNITNMYISKSVYPNLDKQIKAGDIISSPNTSTTATVTGAVVSADSNNWGVPVTVVPIPGPYTFSGARHTITNTGAVISEDFPSFQSLQFNNPQQDFLRVPPSADWNLGNNWTMEFWIKANNPSNAGVNIPGGQWGLLNQGGWYYGMPNDNCILVGLAGGNLSINQSATSAIEFAEPPVGGVPDIVTAITDSSGSWESNYGTNIATTGGTGIGLTVDVSAAGSGYAGTVAINTPGSGYTTGDVITAVNGSVNGGSSVTFTITASARGIWTHVAIVNNTGTQTVWYNGSEQTKVSGSYISNGKTNTSDSLYIGRLAPNYNGYFDGKMAMVRISNTAKYLAPFIHTTAYGVEADTVLFLDKVNSLDDASASDHSVVNNGVTVSTDFPIPPTYLVQAEAGDEGDLWAFSFVGTNILPGTYYWTATNTTDIESPSGELFTITETEAIYVASREFPIIADATTEGPETFTVSVRLGSITGLILATSDPITINDTSTTPP